LVGKIMTMDEPRRWYSAQVSGLDIRYGPEGSHPLLGRRMPDLDLLVAGSPTRLFELMHDARPLLLDLGRAACSCPEPWRGRVKQVGATFEGRCELPLIGPVCVPPAILIRPDGHVAWLAEDGDHGLAQALAAWFGNPA
jgi:3-(3-hydroxy-phenyl)propionate hydroxylase